MTTESIYRVECLCGHKIATHNRVTVCEHCLRLLIVEWRGEHIIVTNEDAVFLVAAAADKKLAARAPAPPPPAPCPDCQECAKHAYSDATTPGFFSPYCEKHRPKPAETILAAEVPAEKPKARGATA